METSFYLNMFRANCCGKFRWWIFGKVVCEVGKNVSACNCKLCLKKTTRAYSSLKKEFYGKGKVERNFTQRFTFPGKIKLRLKVNKKPINILQVQDILVFNIAYHSSHANFSVCCGSSDIIHNFYWQLDVYYPVTSFLLFTAYAKGATFRDFVSIRLKLQALQCEIKIEIIQHFYY